MTVVTAFPDDEPPVRVLLSIEQAAEWLGVCRSTFMKLKASGQIAWVPVGSRCLIPRDALVDFVARNRTDR